MCVYLYTCFFLYSFCILHCCDCVRAVIRACVVVVEKSPEHQVFKVSSKCSRTAKGSLAPPAMLLYIFAQGFFISVLFIFNCTAHSLGARPRKIVLF